MFTIGPLARLRAQAASPQRYMADPFSASYVAVEQFNPSRYYEETGMTPRSLPTGTTGQQSTASGPGKLSDYLPFVAIIVVIWILERRKLSILARASA